MQSAAAAVAATFAAKVQSGEVKTTSPEDCS
jgi:hypothetical protein